MSVDSSIRTFLHMSCHLKPEMGVKEAGSGDGEEERMRETGEEEYMYLHTRCTQACVHITQNVHSSTDLHVVSLSHMFMLVTVHVPQCIKQEYTVCLR